jgi:mono/diheme cytochrome c family protein
VELPAHADLLEGGPGAGVRQHGDHQAGLGHAADGSGSTPTGKAMKVRDLRGDDVQKQSDAELAKTIGDGKGKMPGFGKTLSAEHIANVVSFIRTLKKK